MTKYPTGVEAHGESLRIWFMYNGRRHRENLGVPDTIKNRKMAGEMRASVCFAIKMGTFDYALQFPNSSTINHKSAQGKEITIADLAEKWLDLKSTEITKNALNRYTSFIDICAFLIGASRNISSLLYEDILSLRKLLLTGNQISGINQRNRNKKIGRSVRTVNVYLSCFKAMMEFAVNCGYLQSSPFGGIKPLKRDKVDPDPLTRDEFARFIASCTNEQTRNLWTLAVSTGMRHGELCALSWEDIDTRNWTIAICRNLPIKDHFTPPKTTSGIRTITLTIPAINALKSQMFYTKMCRQVEVDVHLREYGKVRKDMCSFVFKPQQSSNNGTGGEWYASGSFGSTWNSTLKRAGIRHRKAYESRHTYACWALSAGANPNFIAEQMGHTSAQMVYTVYGKWMSDNNSSQMDILNASFTQNAPLMPHAANGSH
ncbi:site-specific integrase [Morganella psychrotolerans]|uniref:Integrase n=1 Tax=Morganella psychrotolerans TaxID=368603 RepID=A0A1B8HS64_9GAMM|nr:site-specific integrase [Morganella psychrotolerans]OBU12347.1 integrase [Morganella psychrotolerans]